MEFILKTLKNIISKILVVEIKVFIDTQLWIFALKIPEEKDFNNKQEYENSFKNYEVANNFLKDKLHSDEIHMTYLQLGEIFHALGFRGKKLPLNYVQEYCSQLLSGEYMHWYDINYKTIKKALEISTLSKIHVWDYLCVLPFHKDIEIIFSCDKHFTHDSFKSLGPSVENPIKDWFLL